MGASLKQAFYLLMLGKSRKVGMLFRLSLRKAVKVHYSTVLPKRFGDPKFVNSPRN